MNPSKTSKLLNSQKLEKVSIENEICPDQKVDTLVTDNKGFLIKKPFINWQRTTNLNSSNHRIILVLESPHIEEFKNSIGPAKGITGKNIANYISMVLGNSILSPNTNYDLILMNAIQFQCSMGVKPIHFRTLAFIHLWFDGGKRNFIDRITNLKLKKDDVLINACTKGNISNCKKHYKKTLTEKNIKAILKIKRSLSFNKKNNYLKGLINDVYHLFKNKIPCKCYETNHPSSWYNSRSRLIRRI